MANQIPDGMGLDPHELETRVEAAINEAFKAAIRKDHPDRNFGSAAANEQG